MNLLKNTEKNNMTGENGQFSTPGRNLQIHKKKSLKALAGKEQTRKNEETPHLFPAGAERKKKTLGRENTIVKRKKKNTGNPRDIYQSMAAKKRGGLRHYDQGGWAKLPSPRAPS